MDKHKIKAIETHYNGYRFRSRLEARWAVFFDTLDIQWEYEKQGYDLDGLLYLPDFWLPEKQCWLEIKGEYINGYSWDSKTNFYVAIERKQSRLKEALESIEKDTWMDESDKKNIYSYWKAKYAYPLPTDDQLKDLTKARRLAVGSGHSVFMLFSHIGPPVFNIEEVLPWQNIRLPSCGVSTGKAWYADGGHDDGHCYWSECFECGQVHLGLHGGEPCCKHERLLCDHGQKILAAYYAARSARFEHGETPRRA